MLSDRVPDLDYRRIVRASRLLNNALSPGNLKLALLSDAALQHLTPVLRTLFHRAGADVEIYEGAFDAVQVGAFDTSSGLYRFEPDAIAILNSVQALRARFCSRKVSAPDFLEVEIARVTQIWDAIQAHSRAIVLQSNFVAPYERHFGNFDQKVPESFSSVVAALNARIADCARGRGGVLIQDVESVASWVGRRTWFDDRLWDIAKIFCALDHLPLVAQNMVDMVSAARGRVVKCVVADLDNTLWGGVIGDDGLDGIRLNAHGDGEAYYRLQQYLLELVRRGILLAVCSKNNYEDAILPFDKHPDMVLKREHVAAFVANWDDKAKNIRAIRETLNIGFDSMVLLDDNPFERNLVRELVAGVIVPELPEDPADYVRAVAELNLFETTSFSSEDVKRTDRYRAEQERRQRQAAYSNVDEFLRSLDMRITVTRFDPFHLPRIAQLFQRSNQFNLTTRRRGEADCKALMVEDRYLPLYAGLSDRLGDHGLISIVVLEKLDGELAIRDWLMSCRVIARGVEQYLMNEVIGHARRLGLERVSGEFIPTAKNAMVTDFFARFGFTKVREVEGHSQWVLKVDSYRPVPVSIAPAMPAPAAV